MTDAIPPKYFAFPVNGTNLGMELGVYTVDFKSGKVRGGGEGYYLGDRLGSRQHIRVLKVKESSEAQSIDFWFEGSEKKIRCQPGDERDVGHLGDMDKLYLQATGSGAELRIEASTDESAFFFSGYQLKKKSPRSRRTTLP